MTDKLANKHRQLRLTVRFFYDIQELRLQAAGRVRSAEKDAQLAAHDQQFLASVTDGLTAIEKQTWVEIRTMLRKDPFYRAYLEDQRGVGPTLAAVILSHINIGKCNTVSALWRYVGLGVDTRDGKAERRRKGEKCGYNPWLKSKLGYGLGVSFLRSSSPWREFYDDYKHRLESRRLPECMACKGTGKVNKDKCVNCGGTGGPAPWGRSDAHRHLAAMRYMVKMFLKDLWIHWREHEGLEVRGDYASEYLGKQHASAS